MSKPHGRTQEPQDAELREDAEEAGRYSWVCAWCTAQWPGFKGLEFRESEMLVLMRNREENVIISVPGYPPIKVAVVDIKVDQLGSKRVKLGFEAHKDIICHREEIWDRIQAGEVRAS